MLFSKSGTFKESKLNLQNFHEGWNLKANKKLTPISMKNLKRKHMKKRHVIQQGTRNVPCKLNSFEFTDGNETRKLPIIIIPDLETTFVSAWNKKRETRKKTFEVGA